MQARGDFFLLRNERSGPMHGKPDCFGDGDEWDRG